MFGSIDLMEFVDALLVSLQHGTKTDPSMLNTRVVLFCENVVTYLS